MTTPFRLVFCILLVVSPAFAQDQRPPQDQRTPPVMARVRENLSKLDLTDDQKARFEELFAGTQKKLDAIFSDPNADRASMRAKADALMVELRQGVQQVLAREQMEKLRTLMQAGGGGPAREPATRPDTAGLVPLTELGQKKYQGFEGGLYPDGKNERPAAHEAAGLALAKQIVPRDAEGKPADDGRIVLLSVGMSNTTQEFSAFKRLADADPKKNAKLVIVDGAQGGMTAARICDPKGQTGGAQFWATVDQRLKAAGVTSAQVQAVWLKEADAQPADAFPKHARTLQEELAKVAQVIQSRFPNIKQVYLSSRTYGGYAVTALNPDPFAYESGFSVKWLIEQQLKGDPALNFDPAKGEVKAPWLSWGPYLWANGTTKRADGLAYAREDFGNDGTHPSPAGQQKVARLLLDFLKTDPAAKGWFAP